MREVSIENAERVGHTLINESYMLDEETMVRLTVTPSPLEQIEAEKANAKAALILGVPALFSFEVVKCEDKYGIIFEHIRSKTFGKQIMDDPEHLDHYIDLYADTLKSIHQIHVPDDSTLRSEKTIFKENIMAMGNLLSEDEKQKCCALVDIIPERDTFVSRGFIPKDIMYQDDKLLMNGFAYSGYGHPIFDLADLAVSLADTSESNISERFNNLLLNMDKATTAKLWDGLVHRYFNFETEKEYQDTVQMIRYFAKLKNLIMPVLAPNLKDEYKYGTVESSRKQFFPYLDEWMDKFKKLNF